MDKSYVCKGCSGMKVATYTVICRACGGSGTNLGKKVQDQLDTYDATE